MENKMTIFKYKRDGKLYLLYENRYHYYGSITAEPYGWFGKKMFDLSQAKIKDMIIVGCR